MSIIKKIAVYKNNQWYNNDIGATANHITYSTTNDLPGDNVEATLTSFFNGSLAGNNIPVLLATNTSGQIVRTGFTPTDLTEMQQASDGTAIATLNTKVAPLDRIFKKVVTITTSNDLENVFDPTGYIYNVGDQNYIEVYLNGLKLTDLEYTVTVDSNNNNQITVSLVNVTVSGNSDVIEIVFRR